jgi:hypothetical protein
LGSKSLSLKDVLVVSQLKKNLISLVKLTKDNNCVFCLFSMRLCYKGFGNEADTFKKTNENNLYSIPVHALSHSFRKLSCNSATFIAHTAKAASSSTWHCRLGHPGSKVLK